MPVIIDENEFQESEIFNTTVEIKNTDKKVKYVYLAFDENGNIKGIFNNEKEAKEESIGIVKCFPIL